MGNNRYVIVFVGMELSVEDYYEFEEVPPSPDRWCEHRDPTESSEDYCPECGDPRPTSYTKPSLDEDAWPEQCFDLLEDAKDRFDKAEDFNAPTDLPLEFGNVEGATLNGLVAKTNGGFSESCGEIFLGKPIARVEKYDDDVPTSLSKDEIDELFSEVEEALNELGFDPDVGLHIFDFYM